MPSTERDSPKKPEWQAGLVSPASKEELVEGLNLLDMGPTTLESAEEPPQEQPLSSMQDPLNRDLDDNLEDLLN